MIEIIPAIDIIDGKCVRLTQGDFTQKTVYKEDPAEAARRFADAGLKRLHMVDLDGARTGTPQNIETLRRVAGGSDLIIDFGGGVRTCADVDDILAAGASMVNVGSIAATSPAVFAEMIERYGARRFLVGADARGGNITINGWAADTGIPLLDLLRQITDAGAINAFVTDVARDGMMAGPATGLYKQILSSLPELKLTASGGVRSMHDIRELKAAGCCGVIVGKAIYEGSITLEEISTYVN